MRNQKNNKGNSKPKKAGYIKAKDGYILHGYENKRFIKFRGNTKEYLTAQEIEVANEIVLTLHGLFHPDHIENSAIKISFEKRNKFQSELLSISLITEDLKHEVFYLAGYYYDYSLLVRKRFKTNKQFKTIYETPEIPKDKEIGFAEGTPVEITGVMEKDSWQFNIKIYAL